MIRVIFACVHNAGRSQMAAAFFNRMADGTRAVAISAGTEPAPRVHPAVVEVMREAGVDLAAAVPCLLTPELAEGVSLLVTMGCGESCPHVVGVEREDWPLRDPAGLAADEVRRVRDDVRARVAALVRARRWDVGSR